MIIKIRINMVYKNCFAAFAMFFLASLCSLNVSAQDQKPFVAHEVIEIGGGQKVEILRCKGEGPLEECDCIYYTDKRQNGRRQWQNANRIREEQKSALLEVTAAKELAKQQANVAAAEKVKEAAAAKTAKEKERTASSETNEVIETIKDQNTQIKAKGTVKANAYRGSAAVAKKKEEAAQVAANKKNALSLKEIARQRDSINRSRITPTEEIVALEKEEAPVVAEKMEISTPSKINQEVAATPKEQPIYAPSTPVTTTGKARIEKTEDDTTAVVDFETLRKQEEENGGATYVPVKQPEGEKKALVDTMIQAESQMEIPAPKSEEEPAPKPGRDDNQVKDEVAKELVVDTAKAAEAEKAAPDTVAVASRVVTDTVATGKETVADTTGAKPATMETETDINADASLKETMKEEMSKVEITENKPAEENIKKKDKKDKKEKKSKKAKKEAEEDAGAATNVTPPPAPMDDAPLTPLQKAAKMADSARKAKENTDSTSKPQAEEKTDIKTEVRQEEPGSQDFGGDTLNMPRKEESSATMVFERGNEKKYSHTDDIAGNKKKPVYSQIVA